MLLFGGSLFQASQPIKHYNIQEGSSIQLSVKGYGGGGQGSDDGRFKEIINCHYLMWYYYII